MLTAELEVIAKNKKTGKCYSSIMPASEWYNLERKKGFWYKAYQIGYYQNPKKINVKI